MWGAIAGDIIGSTHEFARPATKTTRFGPLFPSGSEFTDDTILTIATAQALLDTSEQRPIPDYGKAYLEWGRRYPSSYGGRFAEWLRSDSSKPYNSLGNGSAMRVGPIGWAFESLNDTLNQARLSAMPTHNHEEGIKGAQSVAHAIYSARHGSDKEEIRSQIEKEYGYDLRRTIGEIRPDYRFDETCPGTVPESIIAFLESHDFESAVRLAVSLGGDADTLACITGSIAEAYYGKLPHSIMHETRSHIRKDMLDVADRFVERFDVTG